MEWKTSELRQVMMALARGPACQVCKANPLTHSETVAADEKDSGGGEEPEPNEVEDVDKVTQAGVS